MKKKHAGNYDEIRCAVCGTPWTEHNETDICAHYRPTNVAPEWVADAVARHEATDAGKPEATVPGPSARPMVHALLRAVGVRNGHAVEGKR